MIFGEVVASIFILILINQLSQPLIMFLKTQDISCIDFVSFNLGLLGSILIYVLLLEMIVNIVFVVGPLFLVFLIFFKASVLPLLIHHAFIRLKFR